MSPNGNYIHQPPIVLNQTNNTTAFLTNMPDKLNTEIFNDWQ